MKSFYEFDEQDHNTDIQLIYPALNMSKCAKLIETTDNQYKEILKILCQSSISKAANIPMIVIKSYKPSESKMENLPKVSNGIKLFTGCSVKNKQIEIHRGMTINAIFSRNEWLYVKTAQNETGYVPLETCKPVFKKDHEEYNIQLTRENVFTFSANHENTNFSLLNVSQKICDDAQFEELENIDELEFSMYGNPIQEYEKRRDSDPNSMRLYKIKNYLKSIEHQHKPQINNNDEVLILDRLSIASSESLSSNQNQLFQAIDSGYSDCESVSNLQYSKQISQSCEALMVNNRNIL